MKNIERRIKRLEEALHTRKPQFIFIRWTGHRTGGLWGIGKSGRKDYLSCSKEERWRMRCLFDWLREEQERKDDRVAISGVGELTFQDFLKYKSSLGTIPAEEEEELEFMHHLYEMRGRKRWPHSKEEIPFSDFLEAHEYGGPPGLAKRRKEVIQRIRQRENLGQTSDIFKPSNKIRNNRRAKKKI